MMKRTIAFAAALTLGLLAAGRDVAQEGYESFELVYHSDTRGYYRPCG
jgi:hypothetical protein